MLYYILIGIFVVAIVAIIVFTAKRNKAIKENGIVADAVLSRIDEDSDMDGDGSVSTSYTYYVTYRTQDGRTVEARLNKVPGAARVGDQLRIKYLPEKPNYVLLQK